MQVQEAPPRAPEAELPHVGPPPPPARPGATAGLAAGCALLWGVALLLAGFARERWGLGGDAVVALTAVGGAVVAGGLVLLAVAWSRSPSFRAAFVEPWASPPGWAVFALGVAAGLPFVGTAGTVVWDADSARLLGSFTHVRQHGPGFVVDTQDVLLPYLLLGVPVTLGGVAAARIATLGFLVALAGTTAYLGWRLNRSLLSAVAAPLALVATYVVPFQSNRLPMYLPMLAFGYLGTWLALRTIDTPERRGWRVAAGAAVCLVLAAEAQAVGQLFLGVPLLLVIVRPWRRAWRGLARVYGVTALVLIPRVLINLSDGGLSRFRSNRTDYWVEKGYLAIVNSEFWEHPTTQPLEYLRQLPTAFDTAIGTAGAAVLVVAGLALVLSRGRAKWLALVAGGLMVASLVVRTPPPFPRYFAPLLPGLALCAAAVPALLRKRLGPRLGLVSALVVVAALGAAACSSWVTTVERATTAELSVRDGPLPALAERIDDGKGVIGARVGRLTMVDDDVPIWGTVYLSEEEFVTYLTWPSDEAVIDVMEDHDIGWALVGEDRRLEVDYHDAWLEPAYGESAHQVERLADSPNFCLVAQVPGYSLYRLGPCRPGDTGP
jgi:hypothetical protein